MASVNLIFLAAPISFASVYFKLKYHLNLSMKRLIEEKFKSKTKRKKKLSASLTNIIVKETDQINFKLLLHSPTSPKFRPGIDPSSPVLAASIASTSRLVCTTLLYSVLTFHPDKTSPSTTTSSVCAGVSSSHFSTISKKTSTSFPPVSDLQPNCTSELKQPIASSHLPHDRTQILKRTGLKSDHPRPSSCCLLASNPDGKTSVGPASDKVTVTVSVEVEMEESVENDNLYVNVKEKLRPVSCELELMSDVNWSDMESRKL